MKRTAAILCALFVLILAFTMGTMAAPGPIITMTDQCYETDGLGNRFYYDCPDPVVSAPGPIIDIIDEGGGGVGSAAPIVPHKPEPKPKPHPLFGVVPLVVALILAGYWVWRRR